MKEMNYLQERKDEVLDSESYKGYQFVILSLGTHPTAYVKVPETHPYYEIDYDECDISCHFGLTYGRNYLRTPDEELTGWWLGWDYAHYTDFAGYYEGNERLGGLKKWTTEEIKQECFDVIDQLIEKEKK